MDRLSERKIILIFRETRLDGLIRRHNTRDQAAFFVESRGDDFANYVDEDQQLKQAIGKINSVLVTMGKVQLLERSFLPNFLFGPEDIVVVAGQDGLVANTLKYLNGQPLLAINPAPDRFDGMLLPFKISDLAVVIRDVLANRFAVKQVTMAKVELNDGQSLLAVNDLYIGPKLPVSARYTIQHNQQVEEQSSSGVLVSTGLGSTGWLRSMLVGANCIVGGRQQSDADIAGFPWDASELRYCVREPFPSRTTGTSMVFGKIKPNESFSLVSRMADGGVIFSDGIIDDAVEFNAGAIANVGIAEVRGRLVGH